MDQVVHTIPFLVRNQNDLELAKMCLGSLTQSDPNGIVVLYNQGILNNGELEFLLKNFNLRFIVLGKAVNIGISQGRMACFQYIWTQLPDTKFISEVHVDMFFPKDWLAELVRFLEDNNDEPMVCPGILTSRGELHPEEKERTIITDIPLSNQEYMYNMLINLTYEKVLEGFVHPVLHRAEALLAVGGYDTRFLQGKQGYEDDSLLIGYRYYLGTKNNWKPKCCLKTRVYHATLAQRTSLADKNQDFEKNLKGLVYQYGIKGLMELSSIYQENSHFREVIVQLLKQI
ncbi:MAG: hypothetical protein VR72_10965 [Clostridiaceae bacterium BRH_c20a]|nr:MAG: hypothetical protein VR72_10965 [Clostridiaceae bacterium BRH_c20a]